MMNIRNLTWGTDSLTMGINMKVHVCVTIGMYV